MNKEERAKINNGVIKALNKLKVNYRLTDNQSSQFNVYINNSLIVYYAVKKTLYYKENRKFRTTRFFYDEKYENQKIEDLVNFIKEKKSKEILKKPKDYMSEEEKEVIHNMARAIKYLGTNFKITEDEIIDIFTNNKVTKKEINELSSQYISKDKIREKMKKVKELSTAGYEILKELLEEE